MANVPVQAGFDGVILVNKSRGMREVELEVVPRYSEPCTEAHGSGIRDARICHVRNQIKNIVRASRKDVAQVNPQTMSGALCANCSKVVFRLVLGTLTRSE